MSSAITEGATPSSCAIPATCSSGPKNWRRSVRFQVHPEHDSQAIHHTAPRACRFSRGQAPSGAHEDSQRGTKRPRRRKCRMRIPLWGTTARPHLFIKNTSTLTTVLQWRTLGNYLLIHLSVQKTFRFVGSPGDPTNLAVFVVTK